MSESPLHQHFAAEDAYYGGYFSVDAIGCRMKLDIKPAIIPTAGDPTDVLRMNFNFHRDVHENPVEQIQEMLGKWNEALAKSSEVAEAMYRAEKV